MFKQKKHVFLKYSSCVYVTINYVYVTQFKQV
jgi:hypothetical protein